MRLAAALLCAAFVASACNGQTPTPRTESLRIPLAAGPDEIPRISEQAGAVLARRGARAFLREATVHGGEATLTFEGELSEDAKREIAARLLARGVQPTRTPEARVVTPLPTQASPIATPVAAPIDVGRAEAAARRVMPSVVLLSGVAQGTGSIVSADGYILTNAHIAKSLAGAPSTAQLHDGRKLPVRVIGYVESLIPDIGLVKIEASGLPVVEFADPAPVRPGDPLLTIGHPGGYGYWLVTGGRAIGATRTRVQASPQAPVIELIEVQTEVPSSEGSSGGPFIDLDGKVVGVLSGPLPTLIVEPSPAPLTVLWTWKDFLALSRLGSTGVGSEDALRYMREILTKGGNLP